MIGVDDPKPDSFSSRVSLNMVTNVLRTVIMALVGLLMVPYYIGEFGLAAYAILPLATSLTSYFIAIADSLSSAFTRYMVIALQKGDVEGANRVFNTSFFGLGKMMLILLPIVLVISYASPYIFNVGPSGTFDVQFLFLMVILSSLIVSFCSCITSVFMAYNRLHITYSGRIVHVVSQVAFVFLFFFLVGPSLSLVGLSYILSVLLYVGIILYYFRRMAPEIKLSRRHNDSSLLREMGSLGLWAVVDEMGALLFIQASMILVNLRLGSEIQSSFAIVANVISMMNTACAAIAVTAIPLVYRCYTEGRRDKMVLTLDVFSKFVGVMMAFPMAYLLIFAPQVLEVWLGPGYDGLIPMLWMMVPAQVAVCASYPLLQVPVMYKKVRGMAMLTISLGVLNILLGLALVEFTDLGVFGVCLAWTVTTLVLRFIVYPVYSSRLMEVRVWSLMRPMMWSYVMFVVSLVPCAVIGYFLDIPATWAGVILSLLLMFFVYMVVTIRSVFNESERREVLTYVPGPVQKLLSKFL